MNIIRNHSEHIYLVGMLFWHCHSDGDRSCGMSLIEWPPKKHVQKHGNSLTIIISICSQQRLKKNQNNQMVHLCLNNCRHKLYQFSFACSVCHCKRQTEEIDHSYTCYRMSATPHKIFRHEYLSFHYNPIIISLL